MSIILGGARAAPAQTPGLVFWFDGQDPAGNRIYPANAAAQATWFDKSGRGNHVTQATGSQQATFRTNIINGKSAMLFSQALSTFYQRNAVKDFYSVNSYSIFAVVRPTFLGGNGALIETGSGATSGIYILLPTGSGIRLTHRSPFAGSGGDTAITGSGAVSINNNYILQFHRSAANNNQTSTSSSGTTITLTPLTQPAYPASDMRLTIGTNPNGVATNTYTGYMGEICGYVGEPSAARTASLISYLSNRWGIAA